jgi:predicted nucleic acid-binding protein
MIYAVIDTNVLVSALITKISGAATAKVVRLSLSKEDSFLVNGNLKHYPASPRIITPSGI